MVRQTKLIAPQGTPEKKNLKKAKQTNKQTKKVSFILMPVITFRTENENENENKTEKRKKKKNSSSNSSNSNSLLKAELQIL